MTRADVLTDIDIDLDINDLFLEYLKLINSSKISTKKKLAKRTDVFSVSQTSYDCYDKIYLDQTEPKEADKESLGTFTTGDLIHNLTQQALVRKGATVNEHTLYRRKQYADNIITITGTPDAKYREHIIEIKTVSPFAWKYYVGGRTKDKTIIGQPKKQHTRQLNQYLDMHELDQGILLYINKDTLQTKPYKIEYDENQVMQTVGRCLTVLKHIKTGTRPEKIKSNECSYCRHKGMC